jgi:hypothetical protein
MKHQSNKTKSRVPELLFFAVFTALAGIPQTAEAARTYKHPSFFWVRGLNIAGRNAPLPPQLIPPGPPANCGQTAGTGPTVQQCNKHWSNLKSVDWQIFLVFTNNGDNSQDVTVTFAKNSALVPSIQHSANGTTSRVEIAALVYDGTPEVSENLNTSSSPQQVARTFTLAANQSKLMRLRVSYFGPPDTLPEVDGSVQFLGLMDMTISIAQDTGGVLANGEAYLTHDASILTTEVSASLGGSVGQTIVINKGGSL